MSKKTRRRRSREEILAKRAREREARDERLRVAAEMRIRREEWLKGPEGQRAQQRARTALAGLHALNLGRGW